MLFVKIGKFWLGTNAMMDLAIFGIGGACMIYKYLTKNIANWNKEFKTFSFLCFHLIKMGPHFSHYSQSTQRCKWDSVPARLVDTTTEYDFVPGHFSRQFLGPGQYVAFVPGPTASRASGGGEDRGLLSRLVPPTGTKGIGPLIPFPLPRPSHSAHLFSLFLARDRGVLANFFTTFVKIFDSPSIHRR